MATLADLISSVRENVYDPGGRRWSDAVITKYLNEGLSNLKAFSCALSPFTVSVDANTDSVARPSGLMAPKRAYFRMGDTQWELGVHSGISELTEAYTGTPSDIYIAGANIYIRPVPAQAGTLTIVGTARPETLVDPDDTPSYEDVDQLLVAYATAWLWYMDGNDAEGDRWMTLYNNLRTEWVVLDAQRNPFSNTINRGWL